MSEKQKSAAGELPGSVSADGGGAAVGGNVEITADGVASIAALQIGEAHSHVHLPPRPPVSWPHVVGRIPPLAGAFQDRAERSGLRAAMVGGGTVVLCQVLVGMGGVGKTQLATDYAEYAWGAGQVDLLVWVTASSRDAITAAFAQAGAEVCGADLADPAHAAELFLAWLRTGRRRWLVVLDDLADPGDLHGLRPPAVTMGRTVVTTRRRDALRAVGGTVVDVGVFTSTEAVAFLESVLAAEDRAESATELGGLAGDLGNLPLGLSQAAAYIVDAGITVGEYRDLLSRRARSLAEISPDVRPDDQVHGMAAAWELSVEQADQLRPRGLARPMLELAAFLAPDAIPMLALTSGPALDYLTAHRTPTPDVSAGPGRPVTSHDGAGALRALHRLSLLTAPSPAPMSGEDDADAPNSVAWDGRVVRLHQVVQRATRDTLTGDRYGEAARAAADALMAVWPQVERDTALGQALRACTTVLTASTQEGTRHASCLYRPDAHAVLSRFGNSLGYSGQVDAAARHFRQLSATTGRHLGADHPDTLTARHNHASWRGRAGDVAGAAAAFTDLLADHVRVLGPDHPDTLITRNHLARWRGKAGDAAGAATAYGEVLADQLRVLGADHPDTLITRSDLAYWRGEAGNAAGAATAYGELLEDMLRVRGPDDPDTLTTRSNLAAWRGEAGDVDGAAAATAELLEDMLRVLGPDYPDILVTRSNLAYWRGEAGDVDGAITAYGEVLADQLRVLGSDHPDTLITRSNLAYWQGEAGDAAGAAAAFEDLLADHVRVLGPDHPDTLITRNHLATWRGRARDKGTAG